MRTVKKRSIVIAGRRTSVSIGMPPKKLQMRRVSPFAT
jgi:hypothetical protein